MRTRRVVPVLVVLCLGMFAATAWGLAAGDLDPTFSGDGKFTEPIGGGARPGGVYDAMALQRDGKIVAVGRSSSDGNLVVRINPDGTLDPSFDGDGKLLNPLGAGLNEGMSPRSIAIAPDGKIVIAGYVQNYTTQVARATVVRLTQEGAFDNSFDGDGVLVEQLGETATPYSNLYAVRVLSDGRILLAGNAKDGTGHGATLLARRQANGSPDPTFGIGGKKITQMGTGTNLNSGVAGMELQPDGKVVIAGAATDTNAVQPDAAVVARFDADGQALDPSFGTAGKYVGRLDAPAYQFRVNALRLQPDGKLVLVGAAYDGSKNFPSSEAFVARLNANGAGVDSGFATNGSFHQTFEGTAGDASFRDVVLQPDGKIVAVGTGEGAGFTVLVARLTSSGGLDPSFSGDGRDLTQLGELSSDFAALALQPDGKILAAGSVLSKVNGNLDSHPLMARYIADLPPNALFTASPTPVRIGQDVAFDGNASTDPEVGIASHQWDFGDGAAATGATASHRYAAAGSYAAKLTVRDAYGLTSTAGQTITVNLPGSSAVSAGAPAISGMTIKPSTFSAARKGASVARRTGANISYTDSRAAKTTFTVARILPGRKVGKRCNKPTQTTRVTKRCNRALRLPGSFTRVDVAGRNSFRFTGRLNRKTLTPGRYRLSAKPKTAQTTGKPVSVPFQIIR